MFFFCAPAKNQSVLLGRDYIEIWSLGKDLAFYPLDGGPDYIPRTQSPVFLCSHLFLKGHEDGTNRWDFFSSDILVH